MENDFKIKEGHEYIVKMGEKINFDGSVPIESVKELVRCKDCKHRHKSVMYGFKCDIVAYPYEDSRNAFDGDWFCADGERKDGDNDAP